MVMSLELRLETFVLRDRRVVDASARFKFSQSGKKGAIHVTRLGLEVLRSKTRSIIDSGDPCYLCDIIISDCMTFALSFWLKYCLLTNV
jgi:hypothetical protein